LKNLNYNKKLLLTLQIKARTSYLTPVLEDLYFVIRTHIKKFTLYYTCARQCPLCLFAVHVISYTQYRLYAQSVHIVPCGSRSQWG